MATNLKFPEAYHVLFKRPIEISELQLIHDNNPVKFEQEYRPYLYCHVCKKAPLVYQNDNPPYLKLKNNCSHADSCTVPYPVLDKKELRKGTPDTSSMGHTLRHLLSILISDETSTEHIEKNTSTETSVRRYSGRATNNKKYYMPERKLISLFNENDLNIMTYFYGKIEAKWLQKSLAWKYHYLHIFLPDLGKQICSLKVYEPLDNRLKEIVPLDSSRVMCNIAFAAIIEQDGKFYSGEIIAPELLYLC